MNTEAIGGLVQKVQALPDAGARGAALELVQAVMDLHRAALERMMELVSDPDALAGDPLVSSILLLHDLHPQDLDTRVERALDRPEFRAQLISTEGGVVRVSVEGGHGLGRAVEAAIREAAPDAVSVVIEGLPQPAGSFVPLAALMAS